MHVSSPNWQYLIKVFFKIHVLCPKEMYIQKFKNHLSTNVCPLYGLLLLKMDGTSATIQSRASFPVNVSA